MRTFHLPLPDDLHDALRREASAQHRPATELVRDALVEWIRARGRQRVAQEIERFATEAAGTGMDLDPDLEAAGIDCILPVGPS